MVSSTDEAHFREPPPFHTVIVARGEKVWHFTVGPRLLTAATLVFGAAVLAVLCVPILYLLRVESGTLTPDPGRTAVLAYEARLAALRTQVDGLKTRQATEQRGLAAKLDALLAEQDDLGRRYDRLAPLLERAAAAGVVDRPPVLAGQPSDGDAGSAGAARSWQESRKAPPHETLERIGAALAGARDRQTGGLRDLAGTARRKADAIEAALGRERLVPSPKDAGGALGGPFLPASALPGFDAEAADLDAALDRLDAVRALTARLPLEQPMAEDRVSSGFGTRRDPFLGTAALHSGIDYVAAQGEPVFATAPGTVAEAGTSGAYGEMVEIDHGNGLTTRYGHLSRIAVRPGQRIEKGERIGLAGTTGRSTGPHLHYEIRRDGEAIDPKRFFRIGDRIAAAG